MMRAEDLTKEIMTLARRAGRILVGVKEWSFEQQLARSEEDREEDVERVAAGRHVAILCAMTSLMVAAMDEICAPVRPTPHLLPPHLGFIAIGTVIGTPLIVRGSAAFFAHRRRIKHARWFNN